MYLRNGQQMPEHEEGAAFFKPIPFGGEESDQIWGVSKTMLIEGHAGMGEEAARGAATDLPEVVVEGDPRSVGDVQFYETPFWRLLSLAGAGVGAYHGYKRNNSIGWAIGWGLLGSIFPIFVIPIAFAQGIGKPKGR